MDKLAKSSARSSEITLWLKSIIAAVFGKSNGTWVKCALVHCTYLKSSKHRQFRGQLGSSTWLLRRGMPASNNNKFVVTIDRCNFTWLKHILLSRELTENGPKCGCCCRRCYAQLSICCNLWLYFIWRLLAMHFVNVIIIVVFVIIITIVVAAFLAFVRGCCLAYAEIKWTKLEANANMYTPFRLLAKVSGPN